MSTPLKSKTSFWHNFLYTWSRCGIRRQRTEPAQPSPDHSTAQFKMLMTSSVFLVQTEHLPDDEAWEYSCNWNPFQVFCDIKPGFYIGQKMWHLVFGVYLISFNMVTSVHPFVHKWHNFILFHGWIKLHRVYMPHSLYPLICWFHTRLRWLEPQ